MTDVRPKGLRSWLDRPPTTTVVGRSSRAIVGDAAALQHLLELRTDVHERFESDGEIGRGGMSSVHRAIDQVLLRRVAVKVLDPPPGDSEETDLEEIQRFLDEVQITAQLDHPNITPIHEVGRDPDGLHYLVMKMVEGETLEQAIAEAGALRLHPELLAHFLQIFIKVCEAVSFAHSRGVIHRDIKPANIMVGKFGQVYLMDWGIARLLPSSQVQDRDGRRVRLSNERPDSSTFVGTPRYMAPEQVTGPMERIDERTDIFLLGGTLYHILTGRPPYDAESWAALIGQASKCQYKAPSELIEGERVPPGLDQITRKAMAPSHEDRYASVGDLRDDVERFLRGAWHLPTETFQAGELIIREGDQGDAAYIILEGRCMAFKIGADGKRIDLREMVPGDVFGETAIFSAKPRTASVDALEEMTVMVVTRETLTQALGLSSWMGKFVRTLADRFREVDQKLHDLEAERAKST